MKICVSAESTIDMPKELLDKYNIHTTPFGINFNNSLVEDREGVAEEIFDYVAKTKTLPKTSAISPDQYSDYFTELKKAYDVIIHVSMSSLLSSAYNNACLVANEMDNVFIIDSKNLSTGIALLVLYIRDLVDKGVGVEDICKLANDKVTNVKSSFVLDQLNYMHKGGRCSSITLLGANLLKIKPQIIVTNGKLVVGKKYRGNLTKVVSNYVDDIIADMKNPDKSVVFVTHSSPMPEEEKIAETKLREAGFKNIYNTLAGGAICSHCGPGTLGVLYIENNN